MKKRKEECYGKETRDKENKKPDPEGEEDPQRGYDDAAVRAADVGGYVCLVYAE